MNEPSSKSVRLQVAGAKHQDAGRALAWIGEKVLEKLGIREGSVIEIVGKRSSAAIALPSYPEDEGLDIIRLDGLQRANVNVGIGDFVEVRADLEDLVRRAGLQALREDLNADQLPMRIFVLALEETRDSLKHEGPGGQRRIGFMVPESNPQ